MISWVHNESTCWIYFRNHKTYLLFSTPMTQTVEILPCGRQDPVWPAQSIQLLMLSCWPKVPWVAMLLFKFFQNIPISASELYEDQLPCHVQILIATTLFQTRAKLLFIFNTEIMAEHFSLRWTPDLRIIAHLFLGHFIDMTWLTNSIWTCIHECWTNFPDYNCAHAWFHHCQIEHKM